MIFQDLQKTQKKQSSGCTLDTLQQSRHRMVQQCRIGRVATFLDIYIKRDLDKGIITEQEAQEMIDHFTMKLRMVKFARIPSYNQLFSGDPVWATLDVAGIGVDGRSMVTKTDFRFLHTLENMGPAPEPNITVLYSSDFQKTSRNMQLVSLLSTSSIQYENDDAMKPVWGDDYAICCCVSATQTGKEMQFFGASANLAKCLIICDQRWCG